MRPSSLDLGLVAHLGTLQALHSPRVALSRYSDGSGTVPDDKYHLMLSIPSEMAQTIWIPFLGTWDSLV